MGFCQPQLSGWGVDVVFTAVVRHRPLLTIILPSPQTTLAVHLCCWHHQDAIVLLRDQNYPGHVLSVNSTLDPSRSADFAELQPGINRDVDF